MDYVLMALGTVALAWGGFVAVVAAGSAVYGTLHDTQEHIDSLYRNSALWVIAGAILWQASK